jgi:selenocysteine lyase/cysteine desulfurase
VQVNGHGLNGRALKGIIRGGNPNDAPCKSPKPLAQCLKTNGGDMQLDLDFIRTQFPAFSEPALAGQSFFENAGGSFTCRQVIDRLFRFYNERKVQPYAPYDASRLGGEEMDEARTRLSAMMGVHENELSFGPSTTQNVYVLAKAFGEWMNEGDAIIVTNQDHEANSGAWRRLADRGIEVREWQINPETGRLDPSDLMNLLDDQVRLVCFPHCSNVVGEINPVVEITALAHGAGAFVCVDGVSYAPHGIPNVGDMGPDIYMFSSYKTYGPHQGIMVVRRQLAELLPNQAHAFNGGALVHTLFREAEIARMEPLIEFLRGRNDVRVLGPLDSLARAPTVALNIGRNAEEFAAILANAGIMAGGGDFYAVRPLAAMNVNPDHGVLRLSFVHYTNDADIAKLIDALGTHL